MKRSGFIILCLYILLSFQVPFMLAADEITQNLESRILENFDDPAARKWIVVPSKFIAEGKPRSTYVTAWPEALYGRNKDGLDLKVFAVNAGFKRKGYNYLEIMPVKEGADGNTELAPIQIPGRVKSLDLWVWGSNYNYYLEVHLRDFRGIVHVLNLGNLKFTGWQNLNVYIPSYIPQSGGHVTAGGYIRTLELVKFVLWTKPSEAVNDFNVYFDQLKVLTDLFVSRFDGDDLADPETVNEIWSNVGGEQ